MVYISDKQLAILWEDITGKKILELAMGNGGLVKNDSGEKLADNDNNISKKLENIYKDTQYIIEAINKKKEQVSNDDQFWTQGEATKSTYSPKQLAVLNNKLIHYKGMLDKTGWWWTDSKDLYTLTVFDAKSDIDVELHKELEEYLMSKNLDWTLYWVR